MRRRMSAILTHFLGVKGVLRKKWNIWKLKEKDINMFGGGLQRGISLWFCMSDQYVCYTRHIGNARQQEHNSTASCVVLVNQCHTTKSNSKKNIILNIGNNPNVCNRETIG